MGFSTDEHNDASPWFGKNKIVGEYMALYGEHWVQQYPYSLTYLPLRTCSFCQACPGWQMLQSYNPPGTLYARTKYLQSKGDQSMCLLRADLTWVT
jgi:hypothetical protein